MNITITKCENGWLVNTYEPNQVAYNSNNMKIPGVTFPENFVFKDFEELIEWMTVRFVTNRITK